MLLQHIMISQDQPFMIEEHFDSSKLTELPFGLPLKVYRSPMPFGSYDSRRAVLKEAVENGVQVIVDLVPDEEAERKTGLMLRDLYQQNNLDVIYCPIADFSVPELNELKVALQAALVELQKGRSLMVHCNAGFGRTGVFVGCLARELLKLDGIQAVDWVRLYIPTSLENEAQVKFVQTW